MNKRILSVVFLVLTLSLSFPLSHVIIPLKVFSLTPVYPIGGCDLSTNQTGDITIDWNRVWSEGHCFFAYHKATEGGHFGTPWRDRNFRDRMDGGYEAGLLMGAFHFARPDSNADPSDPASYQSDARDEAEWFVEFTTTGKDRLSYGLPPALDLEPPYGDNYTWPALADWVITWMERVTALTGRMPILYTTQYYAVELSKYDCRLTRYKLWIAALDEYPKDPPEEAKFPNTGRWTGWTLWQYAHDVGCSIPGITPASGCKGPCLDSLMIGSYGGWEEFGPRLDQLYIKLFEHTGSTFDALEGGTIDIADATLTEGWKTRWQNAPYNRDIKIENCFGGCKAHWKNYTGGTAGSPQMDPEDPYRGKPWIGIDNRVHFGIDNWGTFLNAHPEGFEKGNGFMTIRYGISHPELWILNPIYASSYQDLKVLDKIYEPLIKLDEYGSISLDSSLATLLEVGTYSHPSLGNCMKIRFSLRPEATWHDGTPITTADVYFTFVELKKIIGERGPFPTWISNVEHIVDFEILDPYNFEVLFDSIQHLSISLLSEVPILPKHIWKPICETGDPLKFAPDPNMIGSGPWRLAEYVPYNHVKLVANVPGLAVTTYIEGADPGTPITSPYGYWRLNPCLPTIVGLSSKADAGTYSFNVTVDNKLQTSSMTIDRKTVEIDGAVVAIDTSIFIPADGTHTETITYAFDYGIHNVTVTVEYTAGSFQGTKTIAKYVWITINEDILGTTWYDVAGYPNYPYKSQLEAPDISVDLRDYYRVVLAYGSFPGHNRWNPVYDINGDYKVDIREVFWVALQYGWIG